MTKLIVISQRDADRARDARDTAVKLVRKTSENGLAAYDQARSRVQPTLVKTQDVLQDSLDTARKTLKKSLSTTQDTLQQQAKNAQKNAKRLQRSAQNRLDAGLSATQDMLEDTSKGIQKNLASVNSSIKGAGTTLQTRYKRAKAKRARAKGLFRWGLILGLILALCFAPMRGSQARERIAQWWGQLTH